jgi:hypothetical protein
MTTDDLPDDIAALQAALVETELAMAKATASDDQALVAYRWRSRWSSAHELPVSPHRAQVVVEPSRDTPLPFCAQRGAALETCALELAQRTLVVGSHCRFGLILAPLASPPH